MPVDRGRGAGFPWQGQGTFSIKIKPNNRAARRGGFLFHGRPTLAPKNSRGFATFCSQPAVRYRSAQNFPDLYNKKGVVPNNKMFTHDILMRRARRLS
jgi:hypothetical protein